MVAEAVWFETVEVGATEAEPTGVDGRGLEAISAEVQRVEVGEYGEERLDLVDSEPV